MTRPRLPADRYRYRVTAPAETLAAAYSRPTGHPSRKAVVLATNLRAGDARGAPRLSGLAVQAVLLGPPLAVRGGYPSRSPPPRPVTSRGAARRPTRRRAIATQACPRVNGAGGVDYSRRPV